MKKIIIAIALFGLFILFVTLGSNDPVTTSNTVEKINLNESSYAFKLASLDEGNNNPSEISIVAFENILADLRQKCPEETEEEIANYIFKGKEMLQEKGKEISLFTFGNAISESIPEDVNFIKCAEIAASLVVLISNE